MARGAQTLVFVLLFLVHYKHCQEYGTKVDEFVIQIKEGHEDKTLTRLESLGYQRIKRIVKNFHLFRKKTSNFSSLLHQPTLSSEAVLSHLKDSPEILFIEQQAHFERVLKSADTKWDSMWYLNGDVTPNMKIPEAWNYYNGMGVNIAIIDDGIEVTHPDLVNNLNTDDDYDFLDGDDDPSPGSLEDSHGTQVAGLIGAEKDNGNCVVGVAYGATMIGVRLIGTNMTDAMEASALVYKQSIVDIYSNSWGSIDGYGYFGPKTTTLNAFEDGSDNGRNYKGAIYVWGSGSGTKDDNCNGDGYVNSIYTIAISSLGFDQQPASYAEICAATLAVTYGGGGGDSLISTGRSGICSEKNLQGTSFATPIATGIIALTLEANPRLTWRDVQHLIVLTSKRHNTTDSEYGGWKLNGAMKPFCHRLGFGLMDAEAMVTKAANWSMVPSWKWCSDISQNVNQAASYNNSVSSNQTVTHCSVNFIEHVVVKIIFEATMRGSVQLTLTSPARTTSYLMTERKQDKQYATSVKWNFMSVHFWGEKANGNWTLEMKLVDENVTGILTSWDLTFRGSKTDPIPNSDLCAGDPCENNASCIDFNYDFKCNCLKDYYGEKCEHKTIYCYDVPCKNGGTCTDDPSGYYCNCTGDYMGGNCEMEITTTTMQTTIETTTTIVKQNQADITEVVTIVAGTVGGLVSVAVAGLAGFAIKAKFCAASVAIQPIP